MYPFIATDEIRICWQSLWCHGVCFWWVISSVRQHIYRSFFSFVPLGVQWPFIVWSNVISWNVSMWTLIRWVIVVLYININIHNYQANKNNCKTTLISLKLFFNISFDVAMKLCSNIFVYAGSLQYVKCKRQKSSHKHQILPFPLITFSLILQDIFTLFSGELALKTLLLHLNPVL